jgi:MraZ protein
VDSKGRVSIPALFRRVLEAGDPNWQAGGNPELVIVYGDKRRDYLECYTIEAIQEVDAKIDALPRGSVPRKTLEKIFHRQSHHMSVDETGRLVLPAKLRARIGLDGEAVFAGAGDTFQIWHPDAYEVENAESDAALDDLPEDFDPLMYLDGITPDQVER